MCSFSLIYRYEESRRSREDEMKRTVRGGQRDRPEVNRRMTKQESEDLDSAADGKRGK